LAAAKAKGLKLGNPRLRAGTPDQARTATESLTAQAKLPSRGRHSTNRVGPAAAGVNTLVGTAAALTARGVPSPSGSGAWHPTTCQGDPARNARLPAQTTITADALRPPERSDSRAIFLIAGVSAPCPADFQLRATRNNPLCLVAWTSPGAHVTMSRMDFPNGVQ
jgi:hypothetical protein